jgi:hypothetical protein
MAKDRYRKVRKVIRDHEEGVFFARVEEFVRVRHDKKVGKVSLSVGRAARQLFRDALHKAKQEVARGHVGD